MPHYMIHAMPKRLWYVDNYLVPSMVKQGIPEENIVVYNDKLGQGNLKSCMNAFSMVSEQYEGTWHLQDDVIISKDFASKTLEYDKGIVCGFCSKYDGDQPAGEVPVEKMWFSFPCIRIPNDIAIMCSKWYFRYMENNPVYRKYTEKGANDDWMFRTFVFNWYSSRTAINLNPNIVDHIDFLIGGTVNSNTTRKVIIRSRYWEDEDLVEQLRHDLVD